MRGTLENLLAAYDDVLFDLRYRTDTRHAVRLSDLDVHGDNKHSGNRYEGTRSRALHRLLRFFDFPRESVFVDFGCGKGKALLIAARFPFQRIIGIEFSRELCQVARDNISAYRKKRATIPDLAVIECDALDYQIGTEDNVFYFFNPFNESLFKRVLENIDKSLSSQYRPTWIIYNNPVHRKTLLESTGRPTRYYNYTYGSSRFLLAQL